MKENVFLYEGEKGDLVQICYDLLMTGKVITYENVLTLYDGGILKVASPTKHPQYKTLQKVFPEVINSLIYYGYSIIQISRGRNTDYQYVDSDRDPLKNIRLIAKLQKLYNEISECVKLKTPITFTYCPFDRKKREIVFHPHLMQKYNNRFFSIGVAETEGKKPFRKYVIALDRISGTIKASSHTYIIPMINEYTYLSHLVGVTLEKDTELIIITLRAHDKYTFGRLTTKPLHFSQKIIFSPDWKEERNYGDVEIQVYPNKELIGQILSYGHKLEVISPSSFREQIVNEIQKIKETYFLLDK